MTVSRVFAKVAKGSLERLKDDMDSKREKNPLNR